MKRGGAGEAPFFAGKIHGVRGWSVVGGRLRAAYATEPWNADGEPTQARCRHVRHVAPAPDCGCGLYALHPWAADRHGDVLGVVEAWGRVEVHLSGFRAEHARPIAIFAGKGRPAQRARAAAAAHHCEVIEVRGLPEVAQICAERGWGLSREVVSDLVGEVPAEEPLRAVSLPTPPPRPPALGRLERVGQVAAYAVMAVIYLAYAAFWAVMGLGLIAATTGWHPLGWGVEEEERRPALVRAPEVRVVDEAVVPPDGRGPPVYVAVLRNRGEEAAVWARPRLRINSGRERREVGRAAFAYPSVVPAHGRALVVQPLNRDDARTVEVRAGPVSARDVDAAPNPPARVRTELERTRAGCRVVATIAAQVPLERLRVWLTATRGDAEPHVVLQQRVGTVPRGRVRRVLARYRRCPGRFPEIHTYPAFGRGQLVAER